MEELRSTDILDKEIQNDARKQVQGILDNAQKQSEKILSEIDSRLEKARGEKTEFYGAKEAKFKKDIESSLPLEKERFLVSYIGSSIDDAISEYLKNCAEERRLELSLKALDKSSDFFAGRKFSAKVYGFDVKKAVSAVEKKLGGKLLSAEACSDSNISEGVVLEADDKSVKCRLTIEELIGALKDKHYRELSDALFAGRLG